MNDRLQRHLLCQATRLHDSDGAGRCRDCGEVLDEDSAVCAPTVAIPVVPDETPAAVPEADRWSLQAFGARLREATR